MCFKTQNVFETIFRFKFSSFWTCSRSYGSYLPAGKETQFGFLGLGKVPNNIEIGNFDQSNAGQNMFLRFLHAKHKKEEKEGKRGKKMRSCSNI